MKKTASVFLALLLLGALFALPVSAAEESAAAASDPTVWQNGLFALWFRTPGRTGKPPEAHRRAKAAGKCP